MRKRLLLLAGIFVSLLHVSPLISQDKLIDPSIQYQEVQGWGGSLCWWANIMGGYSDTDILKICDWLTDPDGLNMNIFRFNIGGGDNPEHNHMRGDGGAMPGYKASASSEYDWTSDENQRKILQQLIASRVAQTGNNDIILEAFSNSPPYWMTKSACSAGNETGSVSNLKDDMYDDFAHYLTDVVKYYHDELGITFQYLEPFNEPYSTWWTAFGGQEGCYFSHENQEKMIRELYTVMEQKDMFSYCTITAMDANSLGEGKNGFSAYINTGDILGKLSKVNVHSYFGNDNERKAIARLGYENNMTVWQSESGPLNIGGTSEEMILLMAQRIVSDMKIMKCPAWIDWQLAADNSPQWGLLVGSYTDPTHPVVKGYAYFVRTQFSRFIKAGYRIIDLKDPNSLAAINEEGTELVLVVVNNTNAEVSHSFDLGNFNTDGTGLRYRTRIVNSSYTEKVLKSNLSFSDNRIEYAAPELSVTTFVIPVTITEKLITDGTYSIRNKAADKYIGIANASVSQGAKLEISGEQLESHSSFGFIKDPVVGGFAIRAMHLDPSSTYVLDVEGVNNADGAGIIQYGDWGGENQRFHFVHLFDNYYKIIIRNSQKIWSIPGNQLETGERVVQYSWDGSDNSIWEIVNLETGISEQRNSPLDRIIVNYSSGTLYVRASENTYLNKISVHDILGRVLLQKDMNSNFYSTLLDTSPGIYMVRALLSNGLSYSDIFFVN